MYDTTYNPRGAFSDAIYEAVEKFRKSFPHGCDTKIEELNSTNDSSTFVVQLPLPGCRPEDIFCELLLQKKLRVVKQSGLPLFSVAFDPQFVTFAGFTVNHGVLALAFRYNVPLELRKQTFFAISEDDFTAEIAK